MDFKCAVVKFAEDHPGSNQIHVDPLENPVRVAVEIDGSDLVPILSDILYGGVCG